MRSSLVKILNSARRGSYAVIAPVFTSLSMARSMIETAEEVSAPLILSYSTLFKPIMDVRSYAQFIRIILNEIDDADIPICLHLDHAESLIDIREAVDVGFCSVMIDASSEPWDLNLERTLQAVEIAHPAGVAVESELGQIMLGEGYYKQDKVESLFTDPEQASEFVEKTAIDALAVSIGNVHGAYQGDPRIDFQRLEEITRRVSVPLVLHGSSGIGQDNLKEAIRLGIRKINLYSEIIHSAHTNMKSSLEEDFSNPLSLCEARARGVSDTLLTYLKFSGSVETGN